MDTDDSAKHRDTPVDVHPIAQGAEVARARSGRFDEPVIGVALSDLKILVEGGAALMRREPAGPPLTIPERTQSLERRVGEIELIAGVFLGLVLLMFILRR